MSNYVDTITVGGTDYPVNIPNGVKFRNPTSITPVENPVIRKNDLAQSLSSNQNVPPSSNAVKTVTDALSSDLAALNNYVEYTIPSNTTWRQALTTFAGMTDFTKVSQRAVLNIGSGYYHLSEKTSTSATFAYEIIASSKNRLIVAVVRANTPYYHLNDNGSYTDMSSDTASGTLKLYY